MTSPPPLSPFMDRAREISGAGGDLINLAQAVVDFAPPETYLRALTEGLASASSPAGPALHLYSPDAGISELRQALSLYLAESFDIPADPDANIIVTPGANHAAYMALSALLEPGDEALLITPWYFNHEMTVTLLGGKVCTVPALPERNFSPSIEEIASAWSPRLKVLIMVSPNNPTGACYSDEWIKQLGRLLTTDSRWQDVWLLSDQTYQEIYFTHERPLSPASLEQLRPRTITVSSFSKSLALAGWRLGFITAPDELIAEVLKIQDSSVICASHAAQWALAKTLADHETLSEYFSASRKILSGRRDALIQPLIADKRFTLSIPDGACFAYLGLGGMISGETFAWDLLESAQVALVPGIHFGGHVPCHGQINREAVPDTHVRLSFGSGSRSRLAEAATRIIAFADTY